MSSHIRIGRIHWLWTAVALAGGCGPHPEADQLTASGSEQAALRQVNSDWLGTGKWGFFMHFNLRWPSPRERKPGQEQRGMDVKEATAWVKDFCRVHVDRLVGQLERLEASHFAITFNQGVYWFGKSPQVDSFSGRPRLTLDEHCDLTRELATKLRSRGIKFGLYLPLSGRGWPIGLRREVDPGRTSETECEPPEAEEDNPNWVPGPACRFTENYTTYTKNWKLIAEDISLQYGNLIDFWWLDRHGDATFAGTNFKGEKHRKLMKEVYDDLKRGNPDSLVTWNPGKAYAYNPEYIHTSNANKSMDYVAGHGGRKLTPQITSEFIKGARWHHFTYLGCGWGSCGNAKRCIGSCSGDDCCPAGSCTNLTRRERDCREGDSNTKSRGQLIRFINQVNKKRGGITIDVGGSNDQFIPEEQFQYLLSVRRGLD